MIFAPLSMHAEIVPTVASESVPDLFNAAPLVFTGRILSVDRGTEARGKWYDREVSLRTYIATVVPERSYKGRVGTTPVRITYSRPPDTLCAVSRCESLTAGDYELFFLTGDGDDYHLLSQFVGHFPISSLKASPSVGDLAGLASDLVAGFKDSDEDRVLTNVELFGSLSHVESIAPLTDLLAARNSKIVHAAIYVALLRLQYYARLKEIAAFVEEPGDNPKGLMLKEKIYDLVGYIRDPLTVQVLITLAASRSDSLRESIIYSCSARNG